MYKFCSKFNSKKLLRSNCKNNKISCYLRRNFSSAQQDVIVVGGGPGGYVCAIKCAQLGLKTTCVEGRGKLGGTCLNVGCIPSKALLHNSHLFVEAKHDFAKRGILVDNPRIDLKTFMKAKLDAVDGLTKGIEGLFKKNKVTYSQGWGKITKQGEVTVTKSDGKTEVLNTKNIIIATGSEPTPLPGIEFDEKDIVSSTGALSFENIPKSMIIVGAGIIGLEMGSVWSRLGTDVTVVEYLDRIMPGTDLGMAKKFQQILTKQGFKFNLNTGVKGVKKNGNNVVVSVEDKSGKKEDLSCEKVLISVGRRPYTIGLGLDTLGIKMNKNMIDTNDKFETNVSGIYAIGDCIKGAMLAHKAEEEGIALAEQLIGKTGHVNYDCIPGVVYTYPEVSWCGKNEEELKENKIDYIKSEYPFMANSRARCNQDSEGLIKILADKKTDRLLGTHIIGPNAGEMIAEAVLGMEYGASTEDIARTTHAHPTLSEAFKEACMITAFGKTIHF